MRKISALILSVVMVVTSLYVPAFSAQSDEGVTAKQLELLEAFGIIDAGEISDAELGENLTRAEAAANFWKLLGIQIADSSDFNSVFYDVTTETPYYKYIKGISDAGYMIGYPDGRFRPIQQISTKETASVLANMLGYKDYMAVKGFDNVILKTALLDGVEIRDKITRGDFLRIIYNALHAPACRITGVGTDVNYEINNDYLGMEHFFGVVSNRGVVDAVPGTGLDEIIKTMNDGTVSVDGVIHKYEGDASALLGYRVKYYYRSNTDNKEIIYMTKDDVNKELILNYEDIIDYSDFTYKYEENNSDKRVVISPSTSIIFNGGAYPTADDEDMVPKYGKVTLVDNDGDKKYDVVMIDSIEFILAKSINPDKKTIFAVQDGKDLELKDADELIITKDGEEYPLDRIINRDLLVVKRTKTDSGYDKVVIEVVKDAKANSVLSGVTRERVTVGDTTYPIWVNMDDESKAKIKAGATVTLFTYAGVVVMAEASGAMASYGYLVDAGEPETFEDTIQFRLMQTNLKAVTLDMNKTVKIDGVPYKAADIKARLADTATLSVKPPAYGEVSQPVKYTLSGDGKLVALDTLYFNSEKEDEVLSLRRLATEPYKYSRTSNSFYNRDTGAFVAATKDNRAYRVPYQERFSEYNYENYNIAEGMLLNASATTDFVDVCNVDPDSHVAEFVYIYRVVYSYGTYGAYIVTGKTQALNDEGDVEKALEVINAANGNSQTLVVNRVMDAAYDELNIGDFIRITTNLRGEVIGISGPFASSMPSLSNPGSKRVFKLGRGNHNTANPPYADGECMVLGTALNLFSGKLLLTTCLDSDAGAFDETLGRDSIPIGSAKVMVMENIRGNITITPGAVDDIKTYTDNPESASVVVVYISGGVARTVFVIENN